MENEIFGTGANPSDVDPRTIIHKADMAGVPYVKGGARYLPEEIENQHAVGICTAISRVQMREKQTGKKYSPDLQYLLQKKFFDGNWYEGSSPLHSNKVAFNIGFLPIELFKDLNGVPYITEKDRYLPYSQYIVKLQNIPESEITRFIGNKNPITGKWEGGLCVDKIAGYALVNIKDPQAIAKAIMESPNQSGILCRYGCQKNWWTDKFGKSSWKAEDIEPLRWAPETSGHQVINAYFDFSDGKSLLEIPNTWGTLWARLGSCFVDWNNYKMNEAWVDLVSAPVINQHPLTHKGNKGAVVKEIQILLNTKINAGLVVDGDFGNKTYEAVKKFQTQYGLVVDGIVGAKTWEALLAK